MKILFVLEYYHPHIGGVETLFGDLAKELSEKGHECVVLTQRHDRKLLKKEVKNGVTIHRISTWGRWSFVLFAWMKAVKLAKNCDLIHTTSYAAGLPAWVAGFLRRKKVVITFHEFWGKLWFRLPLQNFLSRFGHYCFEQFLVRLSFARFIAPSDFTAQALSEAGVPKKKICRIYPGIEYQKFKPQKAELPEVFTFMYFGRLGISKGLDLLLPAFGRLSGDVRLKLIIPQKPKRILRWIEKQIHRHKMNDRVWIQHDLPETVLQKEIHNSHCVVIPSYSEGFGYAAVETMACGVRLISSNQGALSEVVGGEFIKMKSQTEDGLREALKSAMEGEWLKEDIKKFPLEESVDAYLALYQELK